MTNEQDEQQRYSLSTLGRIIYCFISFLVAPFGLSAIFLWWHDSQYMSVFLRILALPFGLAMICMAVYWLLKAFSPGLRFIIQGKGFTYYGLFSTIHVNWDAIESFRLSYSRLGTVLMHLRLKEGVWPRNRKVLDLCGLQPSFRQLIGDFEYHLKISPNSAVKRDAPPAARPLP